MKKVTIKDVAREAGVSVGLVSFAMNGTGRVGESTRLRILEAARRLGYHAPAPPPPNPREHFLGVVVPDFEDRVGLLRELGLEARSLGYTLAAFCYGNNPLRLGEILGLLGSRGAEGLILDAVPDENLSVPYVLIGPQCLKELINKIKNE